MSTLSFQVFDLDFPAGSKNKTAILVTGESEALLVDAGFTRADGHRLAAEVLDSGKPLTTVFISHGDPDFYFGAEVIADAFPDAAFVATRRSSSSTSSTSYEGKLKAWARARPEPAHPAGRHRTAHRRPHRRGQPLRGARAAPAGLPDRRYLLRPSTAPCSAASCCSRACTSGPPTAPPPSCAPRGSACSTRWQALDPQLVVAGHRLPDAPADRHRHHPHPRLPRSPSRRISAEAADGAALTERTRQALPGRRHADRRPARHQGRQGRDDMGLTMTRAPTSRPPPPPPTSYAASTSPPPPATWRRCAPRSPPTWSGPRWPASRSPAPTAPPTASPRTSWRSSAADWDGWTAHDDTYVVDGENVVVLARYTATNKATGKAHRRAGRPPLRRPRRTRSSASSSSSTPRSSATRWPPTRNGGGSRPRQDGSSAHAPWGGHAAPSAVWPPGRPARARSDLRARRLRPRKCSPAGGYGTEHSPVP